MMVSEQLASWSTSLRLGDIPELARRAACRHLLDGLGAAVCGARTGAAGPSVLVAANLGGPAEATSLADGSRVGAPAAALANGTLVHALDLDDTHTEGLVHPTSIVLPTVFAAGQQVAANGAEALMAAVVGYELVCRLGAASPHGFHARGLHATSVCGPLAAPAVASRPAGFDAATTSAAIGIAASTSAGLLEFLATGATTKQLHPGLAAMSGILAARPAAAGAEGRATVVEGDRGLYASLSARRARPDRVVCALGEEWEVARLTVKPYPACPLMHAALDAGGVLFEQVVASELAALEVDVHPDSVAIVCEPRGDKIVRRTVYDAKFSLPWSLAALLIDGAVSVDTYSDSALDRNDIADLSARITHRVVAWEGAPPDAPAWIRATTRSGSVLTVDVPCNVGGPAAPLSDEALRAKFCRNVGRAPHECAQLCNRILDLASAPSLEQIVASAVGFAAPSAISGARV